MFCYCDTFLVYDYRTVPDGRNGDGIHVIHMPLSVRQADNLLSFKQQLKTVVGLLLCDWVIVIPAIIVFVLHSPYL